MFKPNTITVKLDNEREMSVPTNYVPSFSREDEFLRHHTRSGWLNAQALATGKGENAMGYLLHMSQGKYVVWHENGLRLSYDSLNEARGAFTRLVKAAMIRGLEQVAIAERAGAKA